MSPRGDFNAAGIAVYTVREVTGFAAFPLPPKSVVLVADRVGWSCHSTRMLRSFVLHCSRLGSIWRHVDSVRPHVVHRLSGPQSLVLDAALEQILLSKALRFAMQVAGACAAPRFVLLRGDDLKGIAQMPAAAIAHCACVVRLATSRFLGTAARIVQGRIWLFGWSHRGGCGGGG